MEIHHSFCDGSATLEFPNLFLLTTEPVKATFQFLAGVKDVKVLSTPETPAEVCFVKLNFSDKKNILKFMDERIGLNPGFGHLVDKDEITRPNTVIIQVPIWVTME